MSRSSLSENWIPADAGGVAQSQPEGLRTEKANGETLSLREAKSLRTQGATG